MSLSPAGRTLNPPLVALRPPTIGDLFNAIVPGLEAAGLEVDRVCEEGFLIVAGATIVGEFRSAVNSADPDNYYPY